MKINAEMFDRWRIFPRLFIIYYLVFFGYVGYWYMNIEMPTQEQTAFVGIIAGVAGYFFSAYVNTGASLKDLREDRMLDQYSSKLIKEDKIDEYFVRRSNHDNI